MSRECVTHHKACDCREAEFEKLKAENERLRLLTERRAELQIGQYTIRPIKDAFWIEHESGEGMSCRKD